MSVVPRRLASAVLLCSAALALASNTQAATRADTKLNKLFEQSSQSQAMLRVLMRKLPKGADLHNHASGGIYAEDFLRWGAAKDGCLLQDTLTLVPPPCEAGVSVPLRGLETSNVPLYNDAIDALSTRRYNLGIGDPTLSGHERFFSSFGRFGFAASGETARLIAVGVEQAAYDNNLYLELMAAPTPPPELEKKLAEEPWNEADMAGRLDRMLPVLTEIVAHGRASTDADEALAQELNACSTAAALAACQVTVRYLMTVSREAAPEVVFARMARSFAMVAADPRFVGVNIAQPEDGPISLRDYSLHMRMFAFFKTRYPDVKLSLHAGELTLGLTPPRDLRFHIREAVEVAGALRIGHGVDIAYEDGAVELLERMAREHIAVEINLTSNDVILGVKGEEHPLSLYRAAGVPVALSTDDAGVSRGDLTTEYMRAMTEHGLQYTDLRQISRDSLTYSFLAGDSLWDESGTRFTAACAELAKNRISPACQELLDQSDKAKEQWRLEQAFAQFEAELPKIIAAIPLGGKL